MALIRNELSKQRRHIPIRQLVLRAGKALQALKPCFMMGPLSVAQYVAPGKLKFDLVIMDEASQMRPEDAIGGITDGDTLTLLDPSNQQLTIRLAEIDAPERSQPWGRQAQQT